MKFNFLKKKKAAKKKAKLRLSAGLITAACLGLIPIAFFSIELALAGAGFLALAVYVFEETEAHEKWTAGIKKSIAGLSGKYETLESTVARHQTDIFEMKENISEIAITLDGQGSDMIRKDPVEAMRLQKLAQRLSDMGRMERPPEEETKKPAEAPRAIKPGMLQAPQKEAANDVPAPVTEGEGFSDVVVKELMQQSIRQERIDIFVQPVVKLPQRQIRFYEIYGRIRAKTGIYLPASRYMGLAREAKLAGTLDILLLKSVLRTLKRTEHLKKAAPFFINLSNSSLKSTKYMQTLLQFIAKNRKLASRLIFEIPHQSFDRLSKKELQIIEGLGLLGCNFSLDHVRLQSLDINKLHQYKVRYVKIDSAMMLGELKNDQSFADMWKFKRKLEANSITVIAEKIEQEKTLVELYDFDLHYGQGYLFGKPDLEGAYSQRKAAA